MKKKMMGPLFDILCMAHVDNNSFNIQSYQIEPNTYAVMLMIHFYKTTTSRDLENIKEKFRNISKLHSTHDLKILRRLNFLDVKLEGKTMTVKTTVNVKETNFNDCINYSSIVPDEDTHCVNKSLICRADKVYSLAGSSLMTK